MLIWGCKRIRLMTNNPKKVVGLEGYGIEIVEEVPLPIAPNPHNAEIYADKSGKNGPCLSAPKTVQHEQEL